MAPRTKAQKAHLALITAKRSGAAPVEPDHAVKVVECKLKSVQTQLDSTKDRLDTAQSQLHAAKEKYTTFYSSTRVERRKYQRTCVRKGQLEAQIKILQSTGKVFEKDAAKAVALLDSVTSENALLRQQLSVQMEKCAVEARNTMEKAVMLKAKLATSKQENKNLKKCCARVPEIKARAIKRAIKSAKKENTFKLIHKGVYGPQA
jgi:chromosome segregation ATPase